MLVGMNINQQELNRQNADKGLRFLLNNAKDFDFFKFHYQKEIKSDICQSVSGEAIKKRPLCSVEK